MIPRIDILQTQLICKINVVRTRLVCPVFYSSKEKSSILLLNTSFSANFLTDSLRSKRRILFNISFQAVKE